MQMTMIVLKIFYVWLCGISESHQMEFNGVVKNGMFFIWRSVNLVTLTRENR